MAAILKILMVLPSVLAGSVGVIQAIIKFAKELCTLLLNIIVPVFPKTQNFVIKMRDFINKIDEWFQKIKVVLLNISGVKL